MRRAGSPTRTSSWRARSKRRCCGVPRAARSKGRPTSSCAPAGVGRLLGGPVEKGPKDLRRIPEYFGRAAAARDYGAYDIEIVAEVNNAPRLARDAIRREAEHYRASGADLIDIGCTPGRE